MERPHFLEEWIDGATICRENSAADFVWSLYEGCLDLFAKLVPLVSKAIPAAPGGAVLSEEVGRLLSWGDGFEDGELDRTLERDPELKSTALEYLSSLGAILVNKLFVTFIFREVEGGAGLQTKAIKLRSLISNARTILDESEDDESDLESDTGVQSAKVGDVLEEIASDIKFYNLRLMDLLPSIERTALQPKDVPDLKIVSTSTASTPFQVSKPAHAYVLQIRDKFPNADNKLVERLGEANWQRRIRIREGLQELVGADVGEATKSIFMPVSMFHDSGLGSSIPTQSAYAQTSVSHSSFRTSATESQAGSYRVPPTPKETLEGKPFTCEICGHVLKKIKNRVDWKIHVFADLKPYICTSSSCSDELCTFPTRQLWADHEFRKHHVEKCWRCYLCSTQLSSTRLWEEHIKQVHDTSLSHRELQKTIPIAEVVKEMPIVSQTCPMCFKIGMKTRKEFVTHVSKHMENIALAALPRDADSDSASDLEGSINSIESSNAVQPFEEGGRSPKYALPPQKPDEDEPYRIKCICGYSDDDESTVYCETCDSRQHIDCFYPGNSEETLRDGVNHFCADCKLRPLDRRSATERQRLRRETAQMQATQQKKTKRPPSKAYKRYSNFDGAIEPTQSRSPVNKYVSEGNGLPDPLSPNFGYRQNRDTAKAKVTSSYWSVLEQEEFPRLLAKFGTDWKTIAKHMGSKTHRMVENFYQHQINSGKYDFQHIAMAADDKAATKRPANPTSILSHSDSAIHSIIQPSRFTPVPYTPLANKKAAQQATQETFLTEELDPKIRQASSEELVSRMEAAIAKPRDSIPRLWVDKVDGASTTVVDGQTEQPPRRGLGLPEASGLDQAYTNRATFYSSSKLNEFSIGSVIDDDLLGADLDAYHRENYKRVEKAQGHNTDAQVSQPDANVIDSRGALSHFENSDGDSSLTPRQRRGRLHPTFTTIPTCVQCRVRKVRCSSSPTCYPCQKRGIECVRVFTSSNVLNERA